MTFPNAKEIKKLADACRKAGISHFKCGDFEFTLGDLPEPKASKKQVAATAATTSQQGPVEFEGLTEEDMLFWSAGVETPAQDQDSQ